MQLIRVCTAIISFKGVLYTQEHSGIVLSIPECSGVGYDHSQPYNTKLLNPRKLNIHHSVDIMWCFQSKSHLSRTHILQIHFTGLSALPQATVSASCSVYTNNRTMNDETKISSCQQTHHGTGNASDRFKVYPCVTWQVSFYQSKKTKYILKTSKCLMGS